MGGVGEVEVEGDGEGGEGDGGDGGAGRPAGDGGERGAGGRILERELEAEDEEGAEEEHEGEPGVEVKGAGEQRLHGLGAGELDAGAGAGGAGWAEGERGPLAEVLVVVEGADGGDGAGEVVLCAEGDGGGRDVAVGDIDGDVAPVAGGGERDRGGAIAADDAAVVVGAAGDDAPVAAGEGGEAVIEEDVAGVEIGDADGIDAAGCGHAGDGAGIGEGEDDAAGRGALRRAPVWRRPSAEMVKSCPWDSMRTWVVWPPRLQIQAARRMALMMIARTTVTRAERSLRRCWRSRESASFKSVGRPSPRRRPSPSAAGCGTSAW